MFKFNKLLEEKDKLLEEKDKLLEEKDNEITDLKQLVKNIKYETEIDLLRNDCKHSKEVIERIAEQPKTTTNTTNTTNNTNLILPMIDTSHEHIELMVQEKLYRKIICWEVKLELLNSQKIICFLIANII